MYEYRVVPQSHYEVIDGDTIKNLYLDLGFNLIHKIKARLARINAPEIGEPLSEEAKRMLKVLIEGKPLKVKSLGLDKFGRQLVELYVGDINVSDYLLENGLVKKYG